MTTVTDGDLQEDAANILFHMAGVIAQWLLWLDFIRHDPGLEVFPSDQFVGFRIRCPVNSVTAFILSWVTQKRDKKRKKKGQSGMALT